MIGFYNYTVILTYIGTVVGFVGITYAMNANSKATLICLLVCGLCDMFDGKIASTMTRTKPERRFGVQIDSLSDLICFGALPASIVYICSDKSPLCIGICAIYLLCGLIRLAWYNVDEEQRQDEETSERKQFCGLPITASALLVPLFMGALHLLELPIDKITPWFLLCIAIAFITPFKAKKPGNLGKLIMLLCGVAIFALVLIGVTA